MSVNTTKPRKKLKRYDIPDHARELTFSCYHLFDYLSDTTSCFLFLEELERARDIFMFNIWAYVMMPNITSIYYFFLTRLPMKCQQYCNQLKGALQKDTVIICEQLPQILISIIALAPETKRNFASGKQVEDLTETYGMQKQFILQ